MITVTLEHKGNLKTLRNFESPRGLRVEGKRYENATVNIHKNVRAMDLYKISKYLEEIAHSLEIQ